MEYPKLPPEKNRRRKLTPADIEHVRFLVKEGVPRKEVAEQFHVSKSTNYFWCWSEEQRTRHYERNTKHAKERGGYDNPATRTQRVREYRAYKRMVHGAEIMRQFKYEDNKQRDPRRLAGIRARRLERAVALLKQHGREWMEKRYRHLPEFLAKVYAYQAAQN